MSNKEAWRKRFNRAGEAQSKYLWILFVLGVFCWVVASPSPDLSDTAVPFVNVPLSSAAVLVTSPAVILFLQLVIFGALRALTTAEKALKPDIDETTDEHYNAIDWAVYTTKDSPLWLQRVAWFAYPLYMLVFTAEAIYFLVLAALPSVNVPGRWVVIGIAVVEAAIVLNLTFGFWAGRFRRIKAEVTGLNVS